MLLKIIMLVCFLPILLIMYGVLLNLTKVKKNLILGVTLPFDARADDAVLAICRRFKISLTAVVLLMTATAFVPFCFRYDSVTLTYDFCWLLVAMIVPFVPYGFSNQKLRKLKAEKGWYSEAMGKHLVDLKAAALPKRLLRVWWFLPPIIVSVIPIMHTLVTLQGRDEFWPMLILYGSLFLTVVLSYVLYRIIYRQKAEMVDEHTEINVALTQVRRYNWGKCWILTAWLTALFNLSVWLLSEVGLAILVLSLIYSFLLLAGLMRVEFKTRKVQSKLTEDSGKEFYFDEDDHWLWGLIYYNPNDSHAMVSNRVGIGTSMNMAKPTGKILMGFTALLLASMPFLGVFLMHEEFTPVRLSVSDTQVIAIHTKEEYKINFSDIRSVTLINDLPSGSKNMGSAMDSVDKGSFRLGGMGSCRLCLDPRTAPFLVIKTEDATYVFGSHDSSETKAVYDTLVKLHVSA
jgi:uncharacterized membrane protein